MYDPNVNYELLPTPPQDETEVNLRSYFSRLSDERLMEYDPDWTDEQVMAWDDNFTSDGELFLICCEREVDVAEYRRVLVEHMTLRQLTPTAK
ncbi:MAG: hypothetical protein KF708_00975 [Pirellulales bacterium]|nr:hypothetical protein [Pirellulales bacterium]